MVTGKVSLQTKDRFGDLQNAISSLIKKDILVGIPSDDSERGDIKKKKHGSISRISDAINNAQLLYIHSHGVRKKAMRKEMKANTDKGMKYSAAHSLYVQTHGSPLWHSPPRPVLEPAIEANKEAIANQHGKAIKAALDGKPAVLEAELNKTGALAESAAKSWFEDPRNGWPLNTQATIEAKDSDQPLIDKGEMRKAITYVMRDKA